MAIITTGKTFGTTDAVTSVDLNNVANAATFNDPVDETSLELITSGTNIGKLQIKDAGVTKAKIENVANLRVLGNTSGSAVAPQEVEIIDSDTMTGATATNLATSESIKAYVDSITIGVNQTWQSMASSRAASTSYQNTTGKPIMVAIKNADLGGGKQVQVSTDNFSSNSVQLGAQGNQENSEFFFIVPNNHYYKYTGSFSLWAELR